VDALNDAGKPLKGSKIIVLGIAYKKNVDDMRESPSVEILEILRDKGAQYSYSDPHVAKFPKMREHNFDLESVELTAETLQNADAVVLATNHTRFDYDFILEHAPLIIDTRGVYGADKENVVMA
jgi:UDP-N-acetyl-D-glucosamine dehydrogenase